MDTGAKLSDSKVTPLVEKILKGRGMDAADMESFLYPSYDQHLLDPYGLRDMDKAVARITHAAAAQERVVVYGDYDIDGITASAVMVEGLAALGIQATSYIPDRFEEGYGINQTALEGLQSEGVNLVISVDCGITSVVEARWAREHGLDLIITDHHSAPEVIPDAIAVINPKRADDTYAFKDLAGVGVAFKVVQALQLATGKPAAGQEKWLLDLVALGTVCDVVTLVGENRVLVSYGLRVLRRTRRVGLRALAAVGGVDIADITAGHLGFVLGPRMNAAGRLEHAARSVELVMGEDPGRAQDIAAQLDVLNRQRRATQDTIVAEATNMAETYAQDPVLVLASPDWSHGVVGIVASKLAETLHKPVLIAQVLGETTKGSARSVPGFNIVEALRANSQQLIKFGGHFYAAGYTFSTERLEELRAGLNAHYSQVMTSETSVPAPMADLSFEDLQVLDWPLLDQFGLLEPFGSGNPQPLIEIGGLIVGEASKMGKERTHLRLMLRDGGGMRLAAVGFGLVKRYPDIEAGRRVTVRGTLNRNEYLGKKSLQLILSEIRYE